MAFLQINGLGKLEKGLYTVKNIRFEQKPLQKIAITGETGSGKTTLLKMIAGLLQPDEGETIFNGQRVLGPLEKLLPGHPAIAYLSQHFELRNNYRVEEELESSSKITTTESEAIYAVCRIEHLLKRRTNELSGGERQRIVLAKLLTTSPKLLLLDEPFSNLDNLHKNIIQAVIEDIGTRLHVSCILVSHDAPDVLAWADTIFIMRNGEIIQQGTPEQVYHQPVNEYCAGLLGEYNIIEKGTDIYALLFPKNTAQKIMIRPEQFAVTSAADAQLKGIIKQVLFRGSYYTLIVQAGDYELRVNVNNKWFEAGNEVFLAIKFHTEGEGYAEVGTGL